MINSIVRRVFPVLENWFVNSRIIGYQYGQIKSIRKQKPLDKDGKPIPWYTYPALEYLNQFDFSDKKLFEFGSGNSSLYWASRVKAVVSVESNPQWHNYVKGSLQSNQKLFLRQKEDEYVSCLQEQSGKFDIIVIDASWRRRCGQSAIDCLESDGIIILDNSDWYPNTAADLRASGFFQIDFSGFGPINSYTWSTSIFIRQLSNLQKNFKTVLPIGGIKQCGSDDQ